MTFDDALIKDILLQENYITEEDVKAAEANAKAKQAPFIDYLLQNGLINMRLLGQALAEHLKVPFVDLETEPPAAEEMQQLPEYVAKRHHAVLLEVGDKDVTVATDSPENPLLVADINQLFPGKEVLVKFALTDAINDVFIHYQKPLETRFSQIIASKQRVAPELLDEIFDDALVYHASDIHFEPHRTDVVVRFRVDGVMQIAGHLPREQYDNILNRIKVQSSLRIDEHSAAQDGSLRYQKENRVVDMRTSIVPTVDGEKVCLRVLAAYVQEFSLGSIGFSPSNEALLNTAINKPFGMILVVGPTGSGKSTTLYAVLRKENQPDINITTIEDPVEYKIQGINQIQVNPDTNLTFANGLRSIVRQDPDIILVGEIRDQETAEIAVNAALTGHMLFSTFHANDAATALPRLLDMGVEPFLLASTLELIMAQRLVRKICEHCKYSIRTQVKDLPKEVAPFFKGDETITLYDGKKCKSCGFTGYKGRTAIYECIPISEALEALILKRPSAQEIWALARKEGARPLFEDGLEKVRTGLTSLEELLRIAEPGSAS